MQRTPYDSTLPVIVAGSAHYSCRMCGGGCRSYDVLLTEQEATRLSVSWWRAELKDVPDDLPLVVLDPASNQYTLSRVNDRCVFLDTDNLCIVHKSAGIDAKPLACQYFPFHAVQAPDGLHTSLNVSCRRLVEMGDSDPLLDVEAGRALLSRIQAIATIGETIMLTPDITIDFESFNAHQRQLLDILAIPATSWAAVTDQLRRAATYLLTLPGALIATSSDSLPVFRALRQRINAETDTRSSLRALYRRSETGIDSVFANGLTIPAMPDGAPPEFYARIARQWLEGDQSALHRTARTGWVALIAALLLGAHGTAGQIANGQRPDHALNEAIADAVDLFLSPAGQIALTEPAQQAFLVALSRSD
jgi:Fe-S-cluster containining protein